ncbi:MAG: isoleucine--tRNA ligase, partial [Nitrospirae bacterium]
LHLGHALNKILKDIIIKYKSMKGFYTPYVPGWDCHGLPIEHEVDKKLGSKKHKISIIEKRNRCRDYANRFVGIQREEFKRLGVLGDWNEPYLTMSYSYEATIVRELMELLKHGFVYKGKKPVHWCPSCVTALAEAEVEYAQKESPSIYVLYRLKEAQRPSIKGDVYLVIWTTTPWTLPANLAIALHPMLRYVVVEEDSRYYILAEQRLEELRSILGIGGKIIASFQGEELEGLLAEHPFLDRESKLITGDFISTEEGTGLVHIAPGHGLEDYESALRYNLDVYSPVDSMGRFTEDVEALSGEHVFKANEKIIEMLKEKGALIKYESITHSYPHCWRCKKPVIFRATEQWFISMEHNGLRSRALSEIKRVTWIPHWGMNRIYSMVENRPDWCISRQRAWGVPITVIECVDCGTPILDEDVEEEIIKRIEEEGSDVWFKEELSEIIPHEYNCKNCGSSRFKKEMDILDVWFDSGVSHAAVLEKDERLSWPASLYLEGSDQHRGWFQSSLLSSVATRGRAPYEAVLTHGFVVDGEGRKMSKSLGNVISPQDVIKK